VNSLKYEKPVKERFDIQARGPQNREAPGICPVCPMVNPALTLRLAKELSSLLKPVIGKSKHHVRNFSDFASSIAQELLQTDKVMVSFDVVSHYS